MRFSLPGDDGEWQEGKLVLENDSLCFETHTPSEPKSWHSFIPIPATISSVIDAISGKIGLVKGKSKEKEKKGFCIPIGSIRDMKQEGDGILMIKHIDNREPESGSGSGSEPLQVYTKLSADEQVLNEVERELIMSMNVYKFNVYFTHAGEGGVHSLEKNIELEKGLLKIADSALWLIGRNSHKRIAWDDIINVEQKKRGRYKGTEYGALSIDYFGVGSISNEVLSTLVITQGNTIEVLKRHIQELLKP